jgi:hypothetical protein
MRIVLWRKQQCLRLLRLLTLPAAAAAAAASLKIRPKNISRHGRQNVYDGSGQRHFFNIGKVRRACGLHDIQNYSSHCYSSGQPVEHSFMNELK